VVLQEITATRLAAFYPNRFYAGILKLLPSLSAGEQHDPCEFLTLLLDALGADTQTYFRGQQRSILHCTACGQSTVKFEPFLHLPLPIAPTLEMCIRKYCAQESLEGLCPACGVLGGLQKRLHLAVMPPVLILQIQRATKERKLNDLVRYPVKDLVVSSITYDLAAVVTHEGAHLTGGNCFYPPSCASSTSSTSSTTNSTGSPSTGST
jgi:ubiquitin C-terminal hydrolase